jgi:hypothetical protein
VAPKYQTDLLRIFCFQVYNQKRLQRIRSDLLHFKLDSFEILGTRPICKFSKFYQYYYLQRLHQVFQDTIFLVSEYIHNCKFTETCSSKEFFEK